MACGQDGVIFAGMALRRADVAHAAVSVIVVVPLHECDGPVACRLEIFEALERELRAVLGDAKQALGEGVVITHAWARIRRLDAEPANQLQPFRPGAGDEQVLRLDAVFFSCVAGITIHRCAMNSSTVMPMSCAI